MDSTKSSSQDFPKNTMIISLVAGMLFIILYAKALAGKSGRQCSRGWLALMILPFVVGLVHVFAGKFIAHKSNKQYAPHAVTSMILFTITTLIMQYLASAILMMRHVPEAPISLVFKKSFISIIFMAVACSVTILSFVILRWIVKDSKAIKLALKGIPVVGWIVYAIVKVASIVWKIIDYFPPLRKLYTTYIHFLPAFGAGNFILVAWIPLLNIILAPIAIFTPFTPLAALGGHGIACESLRKQIGKV